MTLTGQLKFLTLLAVAAIGTGVPKIAVSQSAAEQPDKYTWLEDIHGERPMAWVAAENARSAAILENDSHFTPYAADALKILDSPERLPAPEFRNGLVYNTWRDADHPRGILRRTTLPSYLTAEPKWETVLDYDALAKQDKQSWVAHGLSCLEPAEELCMVELSAGGEDAVTMREMDLKTGKFVSNGFELPSGKQNVAWVDKNTLLLPDHGAGVEARQAACERTRGVSRSNERHTCSSPCADRRPGSPRGDCGAEPKLL